MCVVRVRFDSRRATAGHQGYLFVASRSICPSRSQPIVIIIVIIIITMYVVDPPHLLIRVRASTHFGTPMEAATSRNGRPLSLFRTFQCVRNCVHRWLVAPLTYPPRPATNQPAERACERALIVFHSLTDCQRCGLPTWACMHECCCSRRTTWKLHS